MKGSTKVQKKFDVSDVLSTYLHCMYKVFPFMWSNYEKSDQNCEWFHNIESNHNKKVMLSSITTCSNVQAAEESKYVDAVRSYREDDCTAGPKLTLVRRRRRLTPAEVNDMLVIEVERSNSGDLLKSAIKLI